MVSRSGRCGRSRWRTCGNRWGTVAASRGRRRRTARPVGTASRRGSPKRPISPHRGQLFAATRAPCATRWTQTRRDSGTIPRGSSAGRGCRVARRSLHSSRTNKDRRPQQAARPPGASFSAQKPCGREIGSLFGVTITAVNTEVYSSFLKTHEKGCAQNADCCDKWAVAYLKVWLLFGSVLFLQLDRLIHCNVRPTFYILLEHRPAAQITSTVRALYWPFAL